MATRKYTIKKARKGQGYGIFRGTELMALKTNKKDAKDFVKDL